MNVAPSLLSSRDHIKLGGHRMTTAHIFYHLPDYPELLQEFIWQYMDIAPEFPRLNQFLAYWEQKIDGRLHSVEIASIDPLPAKDWRAADALMSMH